MAEDSLRDVLRKRREALEGRESAVDAVVDDASRGTRVPPKKKKKKKAKEEIGVGKQDTSALDAGIARVRGQMSRTTDPAKISELEARIKAMKANQ